MPIYQHCGQRLTKYQNFLSLYFPTESAGTENCRTGTVQLAEQNLGLALVNEEYVLGVCLADMRHQQLACLCGTTEEYECLGAGEWSEVGASLAKATASIGK